MSTLKLHTRLADELANSITQGRLPGGSALPTHRAFASQQGIGLSTATRIYAELQRRGLIVGEVGRGTFVRERPVEPGPLSEAMRYTALARTAETVDAPTLRQALRTVSGLSDLERLAAQPSPFGSASSRRAVGEHLQRRQLGLAGDSARIVITWGGLAALRLAAILNLHRGQRVASDAVTYPGWRLVMEQTGLDVVPVSFDPAGPDLEKLEWLFRRKGVTVLHCMPTAHHPLGWVVPLKRRREIVALARKHDVALLEDVTYNHLVRDAPPTLAELAPERTWLLGSLSGVMGDGLRFGYLVAPTMLEPRLERTALSWGVAAPPLIAELGRLWLEDGTIASLQNAQREHAEQLWRAASLAGFKAHSPSSSGWLLWLPLPRGYRSEAAVLKLRQQGVDVMSSEPFAIGSHKPNAVALRMRMLTPATLKEIAPTVLAVCGLS